MVSETADFFRQEQARAVAAAQGLFMERGLGPVSLAEVALALRLPVAELERYFPGGKAALVAAVTDHYLTSFGQQLQQHNPQSSNAVEEMLRVRQTLQELPNELRSLFTQELETDYPMDYQHLRAGRQNAVVVFMQANLRRGITEGLYQVTLDVELEAYQWFEQADAALRAAATSQELSALLTAQVTEFLARVTTPAGAYVTRRLQETAPFY